MGYIRMEVGNTEAVNMMLARAAEIPQFAGEALMAGANVMLPALQDAAPVGPRGGADIRDRLEIRMHGNSAAMVGAWGEPAIPYWVEYGHGGPHPAPAHPYMAPTAEEEADEVTQVIVDAIAAHFMD